jgi:hypothetical protein
MPTSNTRSVEPLTAVQCLAFSIILLISAVALTLTFTHAIIIVSAPTFVARAALLSTNVIIPTCSLLFLLLKHSLKIIQLKTLTTLNYYRSFLILSGLLFWSFFLNTLFWTQYKTPEIIQESWNTGNPLKLQPAKQE